jgi:hypothetical protein
MQDGRKKTDQSSGNDHGLRVVPYEELPLDKVEQLPRPVSMPAPDKIIVVPKAVRTGDTIPAPWGPPADPNRARDRRPTQPYSPYSDSLQGDRSSHPDSAPAISGIRVQTLTPEEQADIEETQQNAARISENMRTSLQPGRLPDLRGLFEDEEEITGFVEESSVFDEATAPIQQQLTETVEQPSQPVLPEDSPEGTVVPAGKQSGKEPLPPAPQPVWINQYYVDQKEAEIPLVIKIDASPKPQPATISSTAPVNVPMQKQAEDTPVPPPPAMPKIDQEQTILPPPARKSSIWSRMKNRVSETLAAASGAIGAFVRRHKTGVAVAAATSLAAATGAGVLYQQNSQEDGPMAASSYQSVDTTPAPQAGDNLPSGGDETVSAGDQTPASETPETTTDSADSPAPVDEAPANAAEKAPETRHFAKVLQDSKSPLVQDILHKGETTLNGNILSNTMLMPFWGLANNAQKAEMAKLQKSINLGMGVFFNEHFGTEAKTAQSLKDPNLRALYATAKVMKEKGWAPPSLTKEKYPDEYRLATQILQDSHTLGLDQTTDANPQVQARVNGNMFQAKKNGDTLKLRKDNGQYHIVLETVFGIFDGKNCQEALGAAAAVETTAAAPAPAQNSQPTVQGEQPAHPENPDDGAFQQSPPSPTSAPTTTFLQNSIGGAAQQGNIFSERPDTSEIDAEWAELFQQQDLLKAERQTLEKEQLLEVSTPAGLKPSELHGLLPAIVGEKLATLYPQADREKVVGIVKRYGFIGFRLLNSDRNSGKCRVQFFKNSFRIIKEVLDKKPLRRQDRLS